MDVNNVFKCMDILTTYGSYENIMDETEEKIKNANSEVEVKKCIEVFIKKIDNLYRNVIIITFIILIFIIIITCIFFYYLGFLIDIILFILIIYVFSYMVDKLYNKNMNKKKLYKEIEKYAFKYGVHEVKIDVY